MKTLPTTYQYTGNPFTNVEGAYTTSNFVSGTVTLAGHRRAMAIKRGKGERLIPLEQLRAEEHSGVEPAEPLTAERIYERRWASTLLDRVLSQLEDKYRARGNAALFDSFNQLLGDEPGARRRRRTSRRNLE